MTNLILTVLVFALIHSLTASYWFKHICAKALGDTFMRVWYRFLYVAMSFFTAAMAIHLIAQVPERVIWTPPDWLRWLMHGIQLAGLVFAAQCFRYLDGWEFIGFRQVWRYLATREASGDLEGLTNRDLVRSGVYGVVRHPLYVGSIVVVTFSPWFSVNGLIITALIDLYFLFGMLIEERRFVRAFGESYRKYMKEVPRIVPRLARSSR